MAVYHLSAKLITRTIVASTFASYAYRAGLKICDSRSGQAFDYFRKKEVTYRRIFTPSNAPQRMKDCEQIWNAVE